MKVKADVLYGDGEKKTYEDLDNVYFTNSGDTFKLTQEPGKSLFINLGAMQSMVTDVVDDTKEQA
jgi:hypothetical protein